jgi:hypothetical protein
MPTQQDATIRDLHVDGNFLLKGVAVVTPKEKQKVRIGTIAPGVIVAPVGPLKQTEVIFPPRVADGQVMFISFTQNVDNVVFTNAKFANGSSLGPKVKAGDSIALFYNEASDKWYKLTGGTNST